MPTLKYYELFEQNGEIVSTGRAIYSTGDTPEDSSFAVLCFMHYLNKTYPEQYHFDPCIDEDKVTVKYYRNGEGVNASLCMAPAEEYLPQNWLYTNMQN